MGLCDDFMTKAFDNRDLRGLPSLPEIRPQRALTSGHVLSIHTYINTQHTEVIMLVLSRKPLERIQIGDSILLTVVRIEGNTVRLGIEAPADVRVFREELLPKAAERRGAMPRFSAACSGFSEKSV